MDYWTVANTITLLLWYLTVLSLVKPYSRNQPALLQVTENNKVCNQVAELNMNKVRHIR